MRLYTKTGATQVDDPEYGTFSPDVNGAFDGLPDGMYAKLHGRPGWENEAERVARLAAEQLEKMRDPATMLAELQKMSSGQGALTALLAQALGVAPAAAAEVPVSSETPEVPAEVTETAGAVAKSESETPEGSVRETESAETKAPVEPAAPAKTTSSRGRGTKAAKAATPDAS